MPVTRIIVGGRLIEDKAGVGITVLFSPDVPTYVLVAVVNEEDELSPQSSIRESHTSYVVYTVVFYTT